MLTPGTIAIWRLSPGTLDALAGLPLSCMNAAHALLSTEERRRAASFHAEEDRRLYVAAHAALRIVLSRVVGLPCASLVLTGEGGAKPALRQIPNFPAVRFNLAHTRRGILIATATGCEVGIDIEHHHPIEDLEALARSIMSPAEGAAWASLAPDSRLIAFYRLWTRKEAYLKAIGLGLFRDLQAITIPMHSFDLAELALVDDRGESLPHAHWQLCDLPTWEEFSAALCWQAPDPLSRALPQLEIHDLSVHDLAPADRD